MAVYTDGVHLVANTIEELHEFAIKRLKFKKKWFQHKSRFPHYDLTTKNSLRRAMLEGAKVVPGKDILRIALGCAKNKEIKDERQKI